MTLIKALINSELHKNIIELNSLDKHIFYQLRVFLYHLFNFKYNMCLISRFIKKMS